MSQLSSNDGESDGDEDEEEEVFEKGLDSLAWLPTVVGATAPNFESGDGRENLPLLPLEGVVYIPCTEQVLNIFEKRYLEMYSDILKSGSKRFVVTMAHPNEEGRFAMIGVLFELLEFKEVSGDTKDQVKVVCNHKVSRRVKLHRVLNPEAWERKDTYLKVEGTIMPEEEADRISSYTFHNSSSEAILPSNTEESAFRMVFANLIELQNKLDEDVRFKPSTVSYLPLKPGHGEGCLWQTVAVWQSFLEHRLSARENVIRSGFQEKLRSYLRNEKGLAEEEMPR